MSKKTNHHYGALIVQPEVAVAAIIKTLSSEKDEAIATRSLSRNQYDVVHRWLSHVVIGVYNADDSSISEVKAVDTALATGYVTSQHLLDMGIPEESEDWTYEHYHLLAMLRSYGKTFWKLEGLMSEEVERESVTAAMTRLAKSGSVGRGLRTLCVRWTYRALGEVPQLSELFPAHGPGSVATGELGASKWFFKRMYRALLPFGGVDLFHLNDNHWSREPYLLEFQQHPITRVIAVPKDVRGPRIISSEPLEMMFLEKALCDYLMPVIERRTNGTVKFRSQGDHIDVLKRGGLRVATLDLKDASDLVSRRLVWQIIPQDWRPLLFALRSRFCGNPVTGEVRPIRAYAPMGSALCFVVLSVVNYALLKAIGLEDGEFSVYGDDLIVPEDRFSDAAQALNNAGLRLNQIKCCRRTFFRETCGCDALFFPADKCWLGRPWTFDITPIYWRRNSQSLSGIASTLAYCIGMARKGYVRIAGAILAHVILSQESSRRAKRQKLYIPSSLYGSVGVWSMTISALTDSESLQACPNRTEIACRLLKKYRAPRRWNSKLQRSEELVLVQKEQSFKRALDGYAGVFASLTRPELGELVFSNTNAEADLSKFRKGRTLLKFEWSCLE